MKVICIRATKRLVKNCQYEVENLWNDGSNRSWIEGKVEIKGIGRFVVGNFRDTSGNHLPKINITSNRPLSNQRLLFSDLKTGDILVCESDCYKSLLKGGLYRIENLEKIEDRRHYGGWMKFEGIKRSINFSTWRFRKLNAEESREMSLNSLLSNQDPKIIKSDKIRKIDLVENKDKALLEILAKSIVDRNRHHLGVVEWACEKIGEKMGVKVEDFNQLMDMPLKEIMAMLD